MRGLQRLAATGVTLIAMPCNTAHRDYDFLAATIEVPLLNIVDETIAAVPSGVHNVALLATPATVDSGLYQAGLDRRGIAVTHDPRQQSQVDALLDAIKAATPGTEIGSHWRNLVEHAQQAGADALLVACTDLTVAVGASAPALPVVDSAQCLARALVQRYRAGLAQGPC